MGSFNILTWKLWSGDVIPRAEHDTRLTVAWFKVPWSPFVRFSPILMPLSTLCRSPSDEVPCRRRCRWRHFSSYSNCCCRNKSTDPKFKDWIARLLFMLFETKFNRAVLALLSGRVKVEGMFIWTILGRKLTKYETPEEKTINYNHRMIYTILWRIT